MESWQELITEVIPGRRRRSFQTLTKEIWQASEQIPLLERRSLITLFGNNRRFVNWWAKGP